MYIMISCFNQNCQADVLIFILIVTLFIGFDIFIANFFGIFTLQLYYSVFYSLCSWFSEGRVTSKYKIFPSIGYLTFWT